MSPLRHAGFIGAGGGCVDVRIAEGKEEYVKEQRNGIASFQQSLGALLGGSSHDL